MKTVYLLCAGQTPESISAEFGDKRDWFRRRVETDAIQMKTVLSFQGEIVHPDPSDALIITGSGDSVMDQKDWMLRMESMIRSAVEMKIPILGICFGHQILAKALGGVVIRNPRGWEVGSYPITITEAGRNSIIFAGHGNEVIMYETHQDVVDQLPDGAILLAENQKGIQSFQYGSSAFGVQFHPEFSLEIMCAYTRMRELAGIPIDCGKVVRKSPGTNIITNFITQLLVE